MRTADSAPDAAIAARAEVADGADEEVRAALREVAREVLAAPGAVGSHTLDRATLGELGWLGLEVPEALGGAGATFAETAVVLEELGRAAARAPYLGTTVLGVGTLLQLEPSAVRDDLLRAASTGALSVAAALVDGDQIPGDQIPGGTVPGAAVTAAAPFHLERTPDGLTLHGSAGFVPDAVDADRVLLLALDSRGTPVIVVTERSATDQPVLDETRRFGLIRADGVRVADAAVLHFPSDPGAAVRHLLDRAAVALACDSLGMSVALLEATVAYVGERHQFGRPVGSFQAVKHACADMLVQVEISRRLVDAAAASLARPGTSSAAASMAKAHACAAAVEVAGKALQLHGGMGYTWESGIHVYLKRATLNRSLLGSPTAHRRRLAERYSAPRLG